jgi:hypothetical protein
MEHFQANASFFVAQNMIICNIRFVKTTKRLEKHAKEAEQNLIRISKRLHIFRTIIKHNIDNK